MQVRHYGGYAIAGNGWLPPRAPPPRLRSARRAWACFPASHALRVRPNGHPRDAEPPGDRHHALTVRSGGSSSVHLAVRQGCSSPFPRGRDDPGSASTRHCDSSPTSSFACSHAEPSRSNLWQVFGLSPPASTFEHADPPRPRCVQRRFTLQRRARRCSSTPRGPAPSSSPSTDEVDQVPPLLRAPGSSSPSWG